MNVSRERMVVVLTLLGAMAALPASEASACSCLRSTSIEWFVGYEHPVRARGFFALDLDAYYTLPQEDGWKQDVTIERSVAEGPFEEIEFTSEVVDGGVLFVPNEPLTEGHRYIVSAFTQRSFDGSVTVDRAETRIVVLEDVDVMLSVGLLEEGTLAVDSDGCVFFPQAHYRKGTIRLPPALTESSRIRFHVNGDPYYLKSQTCEAPSRSWGLGDERTSGYLAYLPDYADYVYSLDSGEQTVAVHVTLPGTDDEWISNSVDFSLELEPPVEEDDEEDAGGCATGSGPTPSPGGLLLVGLGLLGVGRRFGSRVAHR